MKYQVPALLLGLVLALSVISGCCSSRASLTWEYKTISIPNSAGTRGFQANFDRQAQAIGSEGWELSSAVHTPGKDGHVGYVTLIFRRATE